MKEEFPIEKYIPLENEPYFLGRITVNALSDKKMVEVDIIQKESHRIFKHLLTFTTNEDVNEAFELGLIEFKKCLQVSKN
jgi:hypothetical protein